MATEVATPEADIAESEPGDGLVTMEKAFDQAFAEMGSPREEPETPQPQPKPEPEPEPPAPEPAPAPAPQTQTEFEIPESIFDEPATEQPKPEPIPEPPQNAGVKQLREAYTNLKRQMEAQAAAPRQETPVIPPEVQARLERLDALERNNQELSSTIERVGIEHHPVFQQQITQPRNHAISEAKQVLTDVGARPELLDRALSLTGKERYQALEEIYDAVPEAAKAELGAALHTVRQLDARRQDIIANAREATEQFQRQERQTYQQKLQQEEAHARGAFDAAVRELSEVHKLEVLKESDDPKAAWWNDQKKQILERAEGLMLRNTDMKVMGKAAVLAASAEVFRGLFLKERQARMTAQKDLASIRESEPRLDGGGHRIPSTNANGVDDNTDFETAVARNLFGT